MLIGDTAFITGAGQGIGKAVAKRLVADGAKHVVCAGKGRADLESTAAELRDLGAETLVCEMDLADVDAVKASAQSALDRFGVIAIVVNCAGVTYRGGIFDTTQDVFDQIFNINVRGNFFIMQALLPAMAAVKNGVIINISSMLAHGGASHLLPYSASKAALNLITRSVAHSMRHDRVRLNAVNLGWTLTPAEHVTQTKVHGFPDDWADVEGGKQPFGRLLVPEDAANLCAFLASTEASMMTGAVIDLEQWVSGVLG
jgi:NAD(P)-dependent dehydrogenase (short-subunit alcohol dehydrogenase family)